MAEFASSKPKARKPHYCCDCERVIDPGEIYRRGVGFDGGRAWTWKECLHCLALVNLYDLAWDGEYDSDNFVAWSGDRARDLAELRHQASWRMRWRTRSGKLLPIPN